MTPQRAQQAHTFQSPGTEGEKLHYLLYLPEDYDASKRWPLVLFLHGAGERGNNLEFIKRHGLPKLLKEGQEFPFIVVSPQCPDGTRWLDKIGVLTALLDEITNSYAVDTNRIYGTGMSMGGFGIWGLAIANPDRFAAIAPICGGGNPSAVCAIRHVPVWTFHGAKDRIVPLSATTEMVDALKACEGNVQLTIYPDVDHDSWTQTYANPRLYSWLLEHTRAV